jgi:hypothetical protein
MKPFKARCVSAASEDGLLEIAFQAYEHQPDDGPYLDIQRDPEDTSNARYYIEAIDPLGEYGYGYYAVQRAELRRTSFRIRWGSGAEESVEVTFEVDASKFAELTRVAKLMFPVRR